MRAPAALAGRSFPSRTENPTHCPQLAARLPYSRPQSEAPLFASPYSLRVTTLALIALMLVLVLPASGQEPTAPPQPRAEAPVPEVIPVGRIPSGYEALDRRLAKMRKGFEDSPEGEIEALLPAFASEIEKRSSALNSMLASSRIPFGELEERHREWVALGLRADQWQTQLSDRAAKIDEQLQQVAELRELWQRTRSASREHGASRATLEQAASALKSIDATQRSLEAARNGPQDLEARINGDARTIDAAIERIAEARQDTRAALLVRDEAPFWKLRLDDLSRDLARDLPLVEESLFGEARQSRDYIANHPAQIFGQVLLIALLWFALRHARRAVEGVGEGAGEGDPITRSANAAALAHPAAAALLVGIGFSRVFQPEAPQTFRNLLMLTAIVPWLIVLQSMLPRAFHRHVRTLAGLGALLVVYAETSGAEVFSRFVLLTLIVLTLIWLLLLRRPSRLAELPVGLRHGLAARLLAAWLRITTVTVVVALVATLVGYRAFAETGMLVALLGNMGLTLLIAAAGILEALLTVGLGSHSLSVLRMLNTRRRVVLGVLTRTLRILTAVAFVTGMLILVGAAGPISRLIGGIVTAQIGYGPVQFSLGGMIAFIATLWLSFKLARLVVFVFNEEVVPRVRMAPGVPYALGTFARYMIIVVGFLIATAMLGFQTDRLALLVSALGVGIGFGMQNVVNNFVSGVIMLFERPIRVGDRLQLDDLLGDVTSIGIRASHIRTLDGADVIVPNSEFISMRVINWTLADPKRRVTVSVGVRYGTDPVRVLDLLLEAARENEEVLSYPEPESLFVAHGESSLDFQLRVFTESRRGWMTLTSDLTVSINRKLGEAGIEIPYPQRDLHLRSADFEAAKTLRGDGN